MQSSQNAITQLHHLEAEQILSPFVELRKSIASLKQILLAKQPTEFLSRKEVAALLKTNIQTVNNWTNQGKLKIYGIGGRRYYKRHEVEQSIAEIK